MEKKKKEKMLLFFCFSLLRVHTGRVQTPVTRTQIRRLVFVCLFVLCLLGRNGDEPLEPSRPLAGGSRSVCAVNQVDQPRRTGEEDGEGEEEEDWEGEEDGEGEELDVHRYHASSSASVQCAGVRDGVVLRRTGSRRV